jgi:hypothetical protein
MIMRMRADDLTPETEISALIARYGHRRIIMALAAAMLQSNRTTPVLCEQALPDHLRRDIGLPLRQDRGVAPFPGLRQSGRGCMPAPRWASQSRIGTRTSGSITLTPGSPAARAAADCSRIGKVR